MTSEIEIGWILPVHAGHQYRPNAYNHKTDWNFAFHSILPDTVRPLCLWNVVCSDVLVIWFNLKVEMTFICHDTDSSDSGPVNVHIVLPQEYLRPWSWITMFWSLLMSLRNNRQNVFRFYQRFLGFPFGFLSSPCVWLSCQWSFFCSKIKS